MSERGYKLTELGEIMRHVGKRTVYSVDEMEVKAQKGHQSRSKGAKEVD